MSDNDYSDIEIDVEESVHTQHSLPSNFDPNDPKKHARAQHNALERRRRDNIKDMYTSLKDEIPNFNSERASRAQILKKAIDQIQERNTDVESLNQEVEQLEETNEQLRKELLALQEALQRENQTENGGSNEVVINGSQSS